MARLEPSPIREPRVDHRPAVAAGASRHRERAFRPGERAGSPRRPRCPHRARAHRGSPSDRCTIGPPRGTFERPADRQDLLLGDVGEHRQRQDLALRQLRPPGAGPATIRVRRLAVARDRIVDPRLDPAAGQPSTHAVTIRHRITRDATSCAPSGRPGRARAHAGGGGRTPRRSLPARRSSEGARGGGSTARRPAGRRVCCSAHQRMLVPCPSARPWSARRADPSLEPGIVGDDGPAVAERAEVLARVEAEGRRDAERSGRAARVRRAVGLRGILDDHEAPVRRATRHRPSILGMLPKSSTGITAAVRGVIAAPTVSGVTISVRASTSTNLGVAPASDTASAVATNVFVGTTTSSPCPMPSARSVSSIASVPLATPTAPASRSRVPSHARTARPRHHRRTPTRRRSGRHTASSSSPTLTQHRPRSKKGTTVSCRSAPSASSADAVPAALRRRCGRAPHRGRPAALAQGELRALQHVATTAAPFAPPWPARPPSTDGLDELAILDVSSGSWARTNGERISP